MMRAVARWTLTLAVLACAGPPTQSLGEAPTERQLQRILDGEMGARGEAVCDLLRSGIVTEVFAVESAAITYRPGSTHIPHPLCTARWDWPDKAERQAACQEELKAGTQRLAQAAMQGKTAAGPAIPDCLKQSFATEVSLTITDLEFDSPRAAVENLESTVEELDRGVTVEVAGKKHTSRSAFGGWVDGVGDRAAFSGKALLVAADGTRFTVAVGGAGDEADRRDLAIEIAKRVIDAP